MSLRTTRSFYGEETPSLTQELLEELPGILNWAIKGRKKLMMRGRFEQPKQTSGTFNGKPNPEQSGLSVGPNIS